MSSEERPRAVIVAVQFQATTDDEHLSSMEELERLAKTLGLKPVARVTQKRQALSLAGVLGTGKLHELAVLTGGSGQTRKGESSAGVAVDLDTARARLSDAHLEVLEEGEVPIVLVDHDLTPSQFRNLERATGAEVLDRSSIILAIFHRHAKTREAKIQVEIARLAYSAPRLREAGASKERQRGGVGGKGAGESAMELDRRKIRDRISALKTELVGVQREAATRRKRRASQNTVALVGYTNAGKSSLMRALTGTEPYVANKLFATLDTTVRELVPPSRPPILVSDTVGFIKKLPHDLVASFRSTLEEAHDASILLHVVDVSDPAHATHMEVTRSVLSDIGIESDGVLVLNKSDKLNEAERDAVVAQYPDAILLSAHNPNDVAKLREMLIGLAEKEMSTARLFVPFSDQRVVHQIHESARVVSETHDENGTTLTFVAPDATIQKFNATIVE